MAIPIFCSKFSTLPRWRSFFGNGRGLIPILEKFYLLKNLKNGAAGYGGFGQCFKKKFYLLKIF
jgi:hypothetical protein